jgi:AraC-like DNA-binding protein
MLQDTHSLWIFISIAGLLCFSISWMLVMAKRYASLPSRILAACLFCLATGSLDFSLKQIIPQYYTGFILYGFVFVLFMYSTKWMNSAERNEEEEILPEQITEIQDKVPAQRAGLSTEQSRRYKLVIAEHLSTSLAFRRPGYTIRDLANETGIPGYMISLFINQEYGMNFNELINAYRVEYLAKVVNSSFDYKTYTLEALGKMAGFNSRTAFIASIKKHTGMTPSAFFGRKQGENVIPVIFKVPELVRDVA